MKDDLIELIVEKTGVSEEIAEKVVAVVAGYLKDKLPAPIAGQVEAVLTGEDGGGLAGLAGGLLGGK